MSVIATATVAAAAALDLAVAELPTRLHPVAWIGSVIEPFDRSWRHPRIVGVALAVGLPLITAGGVTAVIAGASRVYPSLGFAVAAVALFSVTSLRMLLDTARDVIRASELDLASARADVRALVGRDAGGLSPGEVRSAAVESVAENLVDGLVAPLLAFTVCAPLSVSLATGAAVWVKVVNTLDSMLGYPSKPVGGPSARLDDVVMWLPARLTAVGIAVAAATPSALGRARPWAQAPPSPNSGWPMATLAAALNVRLEKPGVYVLNPDAALPSVDDSLSGLRIGFRVGVLAFVLAGVVTWL